jgi:hypothetical protein
MAEQLKTTYKLPETRVKFTMKLKILHVFATYIA